MPFGLPVRTSCDSLCQARSDYCFAMVKEASFASRLGLLVFVLSERERRPWSGRPLGAGSTSWRLAQ